MIVTYKKQKKKMKSVHNCESRGFTNFKTWPNESLRDHLRSYISLNYRQFCIIIDTIMYFETGVKLTSPWTAMFKRAIYTLLVIPTFHQNPFARASFPLITIFHPRNELARYLASSWISIIATRLICRVTPSLRLFNVQLSSLMRRSSLSIPFLW